jgi:hypothetical protein
MQIKADTPERYLGHLPEDRKRAISKLRRVIQTNIPEGFEENITYGIVGYVIPHSIYPKGYHSDNTIPLPFMSIAAQKNYISLYHFGLYADRALMDWFVKEFPKHSKQKLNIGKSCLKFKKAEHIPFDLIGELSSKITTHQWINIYEEYLHIESRSDD